MNLSKFLSAVQIGLPAVGQIVTELHPENTAEGIKIAASVQLVEFLIQGVQAIAKAASAPTADSVQPAATAAPTSTASVALVSPAAQEVAVPNAA